MTKDEEIVLLSELLRQEREVTKDLRADLARLQAVADAARGLDTDAGDDKHWTALRAALADLGDTAPPEAVRSAPWTPRVGECVRVTRIDLGSPAAKAVVGAVGTCVGTDNKTPGFPFVVRFATHIAGFSVSELEPLPAERPAPEDESFDEPESFTVTRETKAERAVRVASAKAFNVYDMIAAEQRLSIHRGSREDRLIAWLRELTKARRILAAERRAARKAG